MESLLNAEVIKAAASSTLGVLSLMCLILAVIALAFFKAAPVKVRAIVFALLFFGVAGFAYAVLNTSSSSPTAAAVTPEASREFVVGVWQVEQKVAGLEGGSFVDYAEDGRFSGRQEAFVGGQGQRLAVSGEWTFRKISKDQFRLELSFDNGSRWQGTFRIVSRDRIHNIDENYDAVRTQK